jgi:hypothetical protein
VYVRSHGGGDGDGGGGTSSSAPPCTLAEELAFCEPHGAPVLQPDSCETSLSEHCAGTAGDRSACDACVEQIDSTLKRGCSHRQVVRDMPASVPAPRTHRPLCACLRCDVCPAAAHAWAQRQAIFCASPPPPSPGAVSCASTGQFAAQLRGVQSSCCGGGGGGAPSSNCQDGTPRICDAECAPVFTKFYASCHEFLERSVAETSARLLFETVNGRCETTLSARGGHA